MLVKKDCADRVFSSEATMRNFFSAFQIFQLDPSVESVVLLCGDVLTNFLLRRAVRIYVNACQNRLQWACGIPFLWLFVLVGLAQEINESKCSVPWHCRIVELFKAIAISKL